MSASRDIMKRFARAAAAIALIAASLPATAVAEPAGRRHGGPNLVTVANPRTVATTTVRPLSVSVETSAVAIPAGDPFGYTVRIRASERVDYVQTRFQVFRPSGRLIFQRTRIEQGFDPGEVEYSFSRETSDLDLRPGSYPVKIDIRSSYQGETTDTRLDAELRVFDPSRPRVTAVIVARVSGQPLSGPDGKFRSDPARYTAARDDVDRISRLVLADERVRLTLAVNPLLLEEWRRISLGFEIAGPEGVEEVPAESPVAQSFGATLQLLDQAIESGRLELTAQGYADPDLNALAAHGLIGDVGPQYAGGRSAVFASLETTPSTGTVPAGGCVPPGAVSRLVSADVSYCVVSAVCTRSKNATAQPGAYRVVDEPLVALVADDAASAALADGDESGVLDSLFARHITSSRQPVAVVLDLRPGAERGQAVADVFDALLAERWVAVASANAAARSPRGQIRLVASKEEADAPAGFWEAAVDARAWARALEAALGQSAAEVDSARTNSLIAESSTWAGPDDAWTLAERGKDFAEETMRLSRSFLDRVGVTIQPITLAGTTGEVPVSVTNGNDVPVNVRIALKPGDGLRVNGPQVIDAQLRPRENFFEIPVDLQNSLSGDLTVEVLADDMTLASSTVEVSASYLDRLATIGGIVIVLGIVLAFIIRRVRAAEAEQESGEIELSAAEDGGDR